MEHTPGPDVRIQLGADAGRPYRGLGRGPQRCRLWGLSAGFFELFKKRHSGGDRQDEGTRALKRVPRGWMMAVVDLTGPFHEGFIEPRSLQNTVSYGCASARKN
jgi:hypothetical protein